MKLHVVEESKILEEDSEADQYTQTTITLVKHGANLLLR